MAILHEDAEKLKNVLVEAIAKNHPDLPGSIPMEAYANCRRFLKNFESYYSLNYDLLLYWAIMQNEVEPPLPADDGFRTPEAGPAEYVSWDVNNFSQKTFYLHGALHLFDTDVELQKYTWVNTGIPLIQQIRSALDEHKYPLFVAEGEARQKLARIRHSDYLSRCIRSFDQIGGSLVVYGFSFSNSDDHILKCIVENKTSQLFVSLFGDPKTEDNQAIVANALAIRDKRPGEKPLEIHFFSAESAEVWG